MHSKHAILTILAIALVDDAAFALGEPLAEPALVLPEPHALLTMDYAGTLTTGMAGLWTSHEGGWNASSIYRNTTTTTIMRTGHGTGSTRTGRWCTKNATVVSTTITVVRDTCVTMTVTANTSSLPGTARMASTSAAAIATLAASPIITSISDGPTFEQDTPDPTFSDLDTSGNGDVMKRGDVHVNRVGFGGRLGGMLKPLVEDLIKPDGKKKPGGEKKPEKSKDEPPPPPPPATSKADASKPDASKSAAQPLTSRVDLAASKSEVEVGVSKTESAASKELQVTASGTDASPETTTKSTDGSLAAGTTHQDATSSKGILTSLIPSMSGSDSMKMSNSEEVQFTSTRPRHLSLDPVRSHWLTFSRTSSMTVAQTKNGLEMNIDVRPTNIPSAIPKGTLLETVKPMLQSVRPSTAAGPTAKDSGGIPEEPNTALMITGFVLLLVFCY